MLLYLNGNSNDAIKSAAKGLQVVQCDPTYDIFALDDILSSIMLEAFSKFLRA